MSAADFVNVPGEGKIEVVTGDLGSGKTAYAVECIYEQLCAGGWCFTNIEMYLYSCTEVHGRRFQEGLHQRMERERGLVFDPSRLVVMSDSSMRDFHVRVARGSPGEVVQVVIDEAHFDLSARDWQHTSDEFLQFVTLCRKLHIWLIFITQDGDDIDKVVRKKFTIETVCRNLKEERFMGFQFPFQLYIRVRFKLQKGRQHHRIAGGMFRRPTSWGLYNSYALMGSKAEQFRSMGVARRGALARVEESGSGVVVFVAAALAALAVFLT